MINNSEIIKHLKEILKDNQIEYLKILMFGSRARNDFDEESDWDFLIVIKPPLNLKIKKELWLKIYNQFHERVPLESIDLILKDGESFEKEKTIANTISNEAYLEGIEV